MIPDSTVEELRQREREVLDAHGSVDFRIELSYREVEAVEGQEELKFGDWVAADKWQRRFLKRTG